MQNYYIAGIFPEEDGSGYSVYFPDMPNVCAGGDSIGEAIENAKDGLYESLRGIAEDNGAAPIPSSLEEAKKGILEFHEKIGLTCPQDTIFQFIPAPVIERVPVRINITVPKGILAEIDSNAKLAGMTRSGYLVAAAQAYAAMPQEAGKTL